MDGTNTGDVPASARRLRDLARGYAERALSSQADLIRSFEDEARPWVRGLGELTVDDDDDERLVLTTEGRFSGSVVDSDTSTWEPVESPEDVADHYDPVDLFTDLADAIEDRYPGLIEIEGSDLPGVPLNGAPPTDAPRPTEPRPTDDQAIPPNAPPPASDGAGSSRDLAAAESEQLRVLEDLHKAGAITDSQLQEARANLGRRPGGSGQALR